MGAFELAADRRLLVSVVVTCTSGMVAVIPSCLRPRTSFRLLELLLSGLFTGFFIGKFIRYARVGFTPGDPLGA